MSGLTRLDSRQLDYNDLVLTLLIRITDVLVVEGADPEIVQLVNMVDDMRKEMEEH